MTSFSDFEQLSAYLDGELAPQEQATLEARLASEPALQQDLLSLQATLRLLNDLPTLKAPRSYALPTVHQQRPILPLWARAVAALLVAVIGMGLILALLNPVTERGSLASKTAVLENSAVTLTSPPITAVALADTLTMPNTATAPATQEAQRASPEAGLAAESESAADSAMPPASAPPAAPGMGILEEGAVDPPVSVASPLPPMATASNLAAPALSEERLLIPLEQIQRLLLRLAATLREALAP
jgi:anti-sigma factor RsiW